MILLLLSALASAEPADQPRAGVAPLVGLQVGGDLSLSPLGAAFLPQLELGVELPFSNRRFRVVGLGSWSRPPAAGQSEDSRVPDGAWTWELHQTEGMLALCGVVRIPELSERVVPELTLGPQVYLLRSTVDGAAGGQDFGESTEQYMRVGLHSALGVALALGPGELNAQLGFSTSALDGVVTGDSTTMALAPLLGYRLLF